MNHVALIGRLTRDPELRNLGESDRKVCDLRIAVNDGPSDRPPTYVDVSTFDKQAEACATYLAKGRQVAVDGRLTYREWVGPDGSKRSKNSVIGRVQFLGSSGDGSSPEGEQPVSAVPDEDEVEIPF